MAKKFNIHDWQFKQKLAEQGESDLEAKRDQYAQDMMHQDVADMMDTPEDYKMVESLLDRYSLGEFLDAAQGFYENNEEFGSADLVKKFKVEFRNWLDKQDDEDYEPVNSKFTEPLSELDITTPRGGSMSNEHIGALDDIIDANDLGKILNVIAVLVDQKYNPKDAQIVADAVSKLSNMNTVKKGEPGYGDQEDEGEIEEQNTTGTGASFNAGDGAGYATPNAFAKDKDDWENKNINYTE